jgi:hypothetical protein
VNEIIEFERGKEKSITTTTAEEEKKKHKKSQLLRKRGECYGCYYGAMLVHMMMMMTMYG